MSEPTIQIEIVLGMPLEVWRYESCRAEIASNDDWATIYFIESSDPGKGHATTLLTAAKKVLRRHGKTIWRFHRVE